MNIEEKHHEFKSKKRSIVGIIFIVVGAVLIAKKMDIIPTSVSHIIISWQMLLIGIGTANILSKQNYRSGLILITIGTFFILPKVFDIPFEVRNMFWPAIFVVIGVVMLTAKNRHKFPNKLGASDNFIDLFTFMGGGKRKITSDNFMGGKVTSIFGGSELDLTAAKIQDQECVVDVFTMFGGTEIIVPTDWDVRVDVTSIFGGFDDKRGPVVGDAKNVLIIKGVNIFGGGEVKSY
jgi:predicted membrane protein